MLMNHPVFGILTACLCLLLAGGCSHKDAVVSKEPIEATRKADQPKADQKKADQQKASAAADVSSGKVVNAIAAIVNDEVVTLYEVDRESQPLIREAEKKSVIDATVRTQIRRAALEHLIEKRLLDQKIKELNIKVSDEEIKQAIDDVKKQNNMASQAVLVSLVLIWLLR